MKTLYLKIDNSLYEILSSMLKGLPGNKIKIVGDGKQSVSSDTDSTASVADLMKYAGNITWPVDGVEYQRTIRDEDCKQCDSADQRQAAAQYFRSKIKAVRFKRAKLSRYRDC